MSFKKFNHLEDLKSHLFILKDPFKPNHYISYYLITQKKKENIFYKRKQNLLFIFIKSQK